MCYDHVVSNLTKARVEELLTRNNMTEEELAKLINASPLTLKAIQDGRYDPPLSVAHKLAGAFNIPVEKLFDDEDGGNVPCV